MQKLPSSSGPACNRKEEKRRRENGDGAYHNGARCALVNGESRCSDHDQSAEQQLGRVVYQKVQTELAECSQSRAQAPGTCGPGPTGLVMLWHRNAPVDGSSAKRHG